MKGTLLLSLMIAGTCLPWCAASSSPDIRTLSAGVPLVRDEFVVCQPLDSVSVQQGWRYALRYVQNDTKDNLSFGLVLMRTTGSPEFRLALYDGKAMKPSFREFDEMGVDQKLKVSVAATVIDVEFAQVLYATWVRVLLGARHGNGDYQSTGSRYFYVSTYSLETQHMCAMATDFSRGKSSGDVVEIGALLRRYLQSDDAVTRKRLEEEIRVLCAKTERH